MFTRRERDRRAYTAFSSLIKTPAVIAAGGSFTMPAEGELHVVVTAAVVGAANFATARGKTYQVKDVGAGGKAKLGFFEKGTIVSFAPAAALQFDLHVKGPFTNTDKIADHL